MAALISLRGISKRHGAQTLFEGLTVSVEQGARIGIVGPNGAGKSTLLKIIAEQTEYDDGEVVRARDLKTSYVSQAADIDLDSNPSELLLEAARAHSYDEVEADQRLRDLAEVFSVEDLPSEISTFSGGQKKRLQLALAFLEHPDLMLLDEPTNHLDIESILKLEKFLRNSSFAWVAVSHDRWFLEQSVEQTAEVSSKYAQGIFIADGPYSHFLEARDLHLSAEDKRISSLQNKVRREKEWLSRGPKARGTKAKGRSDAAYAMMDELSAVKSRRKETKADISFTHSSRKTKDLLEMKNCSLAFDEHKLFENFSFKITSGLAIGLLGPNGSGKTSFIRMLMGELPPTTGSLRRALELRVSYFKQLDETINPEITLKRVLVEDGDAVVYRGQEMHINTWAKKFQFTAQMLAQPFGKLSGGEKARARIAGIMLEEPDILILDEPTNDLDISALEVLEESLLDFKGAIVMVSHDRFLLNRICTHFLGFNSDSGSPQISEYADYRQWERSLSSNGKKNSASSSESGVSGKQKSKLSHKERKELGQIERKISKREQGIADLQEKMLEISAKGKAEELLELQAKINSLQTELDELMLRWEELEELSA